MTNDNTNTKAAAWMYGGEPVTHENAAQIAKDLASSAKRVRDDRHGNPRWYIWHGPFGDNKPKGGHWRRAPSCFAHGPGYYITTYLDLADVIHRAIIERLGGEG